MIGDFLRQLAQQGEMVALSGDYIPAPPTSDCPGDHLFINCHYSRDLLCDGVDAFLSLVRQEAAKVISGVVAKGYTKKAESICYTALILEKGQLAWVYRYNILTGALPNTGPIDVEYLASNAYSEHTEVSTMEALLTNAGAAG